MLPLSCPAQNILSHRAPSNQTGWLHLSPGKYQCLHSPVRHRACSHPWNHSPVRHRACFHPWNHPTNPTGYTSHLASINASTLLSSTEHAFIQGSIQPARLVTHLTWQVSMPPLSCPAQSMLSSREPSNQPGWLRHSPGKYQCLHSPVRHRACSHPGNHPTNPAGYTSHLASINASTLLSGTEHVLIQGPIQPTQLVTPLTWQVSMPPLSCPAQNIVSSRDPSNQPCWLQVSLACSGSCTSYNTSVPLDPNSARCINSFYCIF